MDDLHIYPCTIINDRYSGAYSGAMWTAWNCHADDVPTEIESGDPECNNFWYSFTGLVGKGETPNDAVADLIRNAAKQSGDSRP